MERSGDPRPLGPLLLAGPCLLLASVILARAYLPEWRARELPDRATVESRGRDVAARLGIVTDGDVRTHLLTAAMRVPDRDAVERLSRERLGCRVEATGRTTAPDVGSFTATFDLDLRTVAIVWEASRLRVFSGLTPAATTASGDPEARRERFVEALLRPGERLGAPIAASVGGQALTLQALESPTGPWHARSMGMAMPALVHAFREPFSVEQERALLARRDPLTWWGIVLGILMVVPYLGGVALFLFLALRRRLDVSNGVALGVVSVAAGAVAVPYGEGGAAVALGIAPSIAVGVAIAVAWSIAESMAQAVLPAPVTALGALRRAAPGPRVRHEIAAGVAGGALLAAVGPLLSVFSLHVPVLEIRGSGVATSVADVAFGPWQGALWAATLLFATAVARVAPPGARTSVALLVAATVNGLAVVTRPTLSSAITLALPILLGLFVLGRWGAGAALWASVTRDPILALVFSAHHPGWLLGPAVVSSVILTVLALAAAAGTRGRAEAEARAIAPPAFVGRLREERRMRDEWDLLARMQRGLLPVAPPDVPGYDIAATSLIAKEAGGDLYDFHRDEAGGLWIAAGDVSGHGYSCAISQAMAKAALASLIDAGRTPGEVLGRLDRVLRRGGPRTFTTLCLLRLHPSTGAGLMANAAHPFPLLRTGKTVAEIGAAGLPLGQGPRRRYEDREVLVPPGATLLLHSDGLYEAIDRTGNAYGFERLARAFAHASASDAGAAMGALVEDWRRHRSGAVQADDTTLVVVRRRAATGEAA